MAAMGSSPPGLRATSDATTWSIHSFDTLCIWIRLQADYALYLASRGQIKEALVQLEIGRKLKPGLTPYDAVSVIGPHINDDPAILRHAAGKGDAAEEAVARYISDRRSQ